MYIVQCTLYNVRGLKTLSISELKLKCSPADMKQRAESTISFEDSKSTSEVSVSGHETSEDLNTTNDIIIKKENVSKVWNVMS